MAPLPSPRRAPIPWISTLVALAAVAVGSGVALHRQRTGPLSDPVSRSAPELGDHAQQLKPNLRDAVIVAVDRPHNPWELDGPGGYRHITRQRPFTVSTNSLGFRGPEIRVPADGFRVVCVGDSVTFGWGVTREESWPVRLGVELGVDVVNAGWPAAEPDELIAWIRGHARELDPDVVLLSKGLADDSQEPVYRDELRALAATIEPVRLGYIEPPIGTFHRLDGQDDVDGGDEGPGSGEEEDYEIVPYWLPPEVPGIALTSAFRARLPLPGVTGELGPQVQRMRRWPGGEVVVEAPTPPEGLADGIIAAFEADHTLREPLFIDEGHPDAEGCALFAREVAAWLRGLGWIPGAQ